MVATCKDAVSCSASVETLNSHDILITHCHSEETDQRLIQHTLHCISALHKIVVRTVDTDVLILLMSYMSQYKDLCTDVNIYAHVNSACENYVISAIFDLGKETCNAFPFFYAFTECDTQVSFQRVNAGRGTHDIKVNRKLYWQMFFLSLEINHQDFH